MIINYFLSVKNKLEKILSHLNEIKLTYCEIKIKSEDYINSEYICDEINEYNKKINALEETIKDLNELRCNNCQHTFVDDLIDITPNTSQHITYCTICGYTKEN